MIVLNEEEIGKLIRSKGIDPDDLLVSEPDEEDTTLQDGIASVVKAIASLKMEVAPVVIPSPKVTINTPKRGNWSATVVERDKDGYIKRVEFKEIP